MSLDLEVTDPPFDPVLDAALADREAEQVEQAFGEDDSKFPDFSAGSPSSHVSASAYSLIVQHETGGRAYYEKVYRGCPVWPGNVSGITIGFGYDLGYVEVGTFQGDWRALDADVRARLLLTVGLHGGNTDKATLRAHATSLSDLHVSWADAETAFKAATLPKFADRTDRPLPRCDELSDDCFGALVSLTFNRGASYGLPESKDPTGRYEEMRAIKRAMTRGDFLAIPPLIRQMRRIWTGTDIEGEMYKRRENEAALFAQGLAAA